MSKQIALYQDKNYFSQAILFKLGQLTYRASQKKGHAKILWISRLPRSLEEKFCTFFNNPSHLDNKNDLISIP